MPPGATGVDFVLPRCGCLPLKVVDAGDGSAIESYMLSCQGPLDDEPRGRFSTELPGMDLDGWRRLRLPLGPLTLRVESNPRYAPSQPETVVVPATDVGPGTVVELQPAALVTFHMGRDPGPPAELRGVIVLEPERWDDVRLGADGTWDFGPRLGERIGKRRILHPNHGVARIGSLLPGTHRLEVFPEEIHVHPDRVELEAGNNGPIELSWSRD